MARYRVIGPMPFLGKTKGAVVEWDPTPEQAEAAIAAGQVRPLADKPTPPVIRTPPASPPSPEAADQTKEE